MNYINTKEFAKKTNKKEVAITYLCRNGKISGAIKEGNEWLIPENAKINNDKMYIPNKSTSSHLPLPIGVSEYKDMMNYYYVDKTLLIKDIIDNLPRVSLFTRPRRFGKTLNMDMLRVFFEESDEDTSIYFKDKKIWSCGEQYISYQGRYPVIFLSFKDVKFDSYEESVSKIKSLIKEEYLRHFDSLKDDLNEFELSYYRKILDESANDVELTSSIKNLSKLLFNVKHSKTVIIIDEYDTPIEHGYIKGFYEKMISFIRILFSEAFKDNAFLSFGFMTGILRVAKESIFSGMNNLLENSILTEKYSEYFGFTVHEVKELLTYYHLEDKMDEVIEWYDGYLFGNHNIINPWSVMSYVNEKEAKPYWQNTGNNEVIGSIINHANKDILEKMSILLDHKTILTPIDTSIIYPEIKNNPYSIFSFLVITGCLSVVKKMNNASSNLLYEVKIPNKEIYSIYGKEILQNYKVKSIDSSAIAIHEALLTKDKELLQRTIQKFLQDSISFFDTSNESFYHGLLLGLYAIMDNLFDIKSNRESGEGRFDIALTPVDKNQIGILVEIKVLENINHNEDLSICLNKLAKNAIKQIDDKNYAYSLISNGIKDILKIGIAFYKKDSEIVFEEEKHE